MREANSSASPTASMLSATMILVGHLGGLAVAVAADQGDVLAHQVEQRLDGLERLLGAADHDGQRGRLGAHFAARHRRVEVVAAALVDPGGEFLGRDRRDRAHVDDDLAGGQAGGHAVLAEQRRFHVRRVQRHDDDDVGSAPLLARTAGAAPCSQFCGSGDIVRTARARP
jgi:hypothetical protein